MSGDKPTRYVRQELIGTGGMGQVWKGFDTHLSRVVAIKELRDRPADLERGAEARLLREAEIGAEHAHPHLVTVHDITYFDGRPAIVMEFVDGTDLMTRIGDQGVSWAELGPWTLQVADALGHLHDAQTVHRDLKPANILLGRGGGAKLGDLGIARRLTDARLTATGMVRATPDYAAPEVHDLEPATCESDVWSLAATLLTAVKPAPGTKRITQADLWSVRRRLRQAPWSASQEVNYLVDAGVPERAARLVSRMLADEPSRRPSAARVVAELEAAQRTGVDAQDHEVSAGFELSDRLFQVYVVGDLSIRLSSTQLRPFTTWTAPGKGDRTSRLSTDDLYAWWSDNPSPMVIVGESGTGKSTAALMLVERILDRHLRTGDGPLALHVSMAAWTPSWGSLREWVTKETARRTRVAHTEYERLIQSGDLVVVLDQVDELAPSALRAFAAAFGNWPTESTASAVLCCQPSTLERLTTASTEVFTPGAFSQVAIQRLDSAEIEDFLREEGAIGADVSPNTQEWAAIREHLDRPVLLAAAVAAFGGQPLDRVLDQIGPDGFWAAFYDARIASAVHSTRHSTDDVRQWLTWLAKHTPGNGTFWLSDGKLPTAWRMALWIAGPLIGVVATAAYLASGADLSVLGGVGVTAGLIACPSMALHSVGDGRMRFFHLSRRRTAVGAMVAVLATLAGTVLASLVMPWVTALACSAIFAVTVGARVATAVEYDQQDNVYRGSDARELIRHALRSGFVFGPLYGLTIGLLLSQLVGHRLGLSWALFWLCIGGHGGYLHHILWRLRERVINQGPPVIGLVRHLEWCATKGLLRTDGASPGFSFPHVQQWTFFDQPEFTR